MWLKDFFPEPDIQSSTKENGKFLIARRPVTKIEPNSLRIKTKSSGIIQFKVPPNTIKAAARQNQPVTNIYVLTEKTFYNGINYICVSFPIFENFFSHKQRKTIFLCINEDIKKRVEFLASEEILGPSMEKLKSLGLTENEASEFYNELKLFYFKIKENGNERESKLSDYIKTYTFKDNYIKKNDVEIRKQKNLDYFTVKEEGEILGYIDLRKW